MQLLTDPQTSALLDSRTCGASSNMNRLRAIGLLSLMALCAADDAAQRLSARSTRLKPLSIKMSCGVERSN
jgi:hypothetical protein